MIQPPPVFRQVLGDAALSGREIQVWHAAIEYLDLVDFRELKLVLLERSLGVSRMRVSEALRALVERGYLVRGDRARGGGPVTYRVPLSRRVLMASADDDMAAAVPDPAAIVVREAVPARPAHAVRRRGTVSTVL